MAFKIKVDEDLPMDVAKKLKERSYGTYNVVGEKMGGWKDPQLWNALQKEGMFLITADKEFGNILKYPPGTHNGVLLLRPDEDGIKPILELLDKVLASISLKDMSGMLIVATPKRIRIRRK